MILHPMPQYCLESHELYYPFFQEIGISVHVGSYLAYPDDFASHYRFRFRTEDLCNVRSVLLFVNISGLEDTEDLIRGMTISRNRERSDGSVVIRWHFDKFLCDTNIGMRK